MADFERRVYFIYFGTIYNFIVYPVLFFVYPTMILWRKAADIRKTKR